MKKRIVAGVLLVLLTGCSGESAEVRTGMALRTKILQASSCSFAVDVTADYGDATNAFSMNCQTDALGNLSFTVTSPETIKGITGTIAYEGGSLTFDDTALYFPLLAEGEITPISAPWLLMKTLRGGCLTSACSEDTGVRLSIDDSYADDALRLEIWLDEKDVPNHADVFSDGRRILSLDVKNFVIS